MAWIDGDTLTPDNLNNKGVGGTFNVKDVTYGAAGDGSTNDTVAIQAASTAAAAGVVYFPKSSSFYSVSGLITVASDHQTWVLAPGAEIRWATLGSTTVGSLGAGTGGLRINASYFAIEGGTLRGPTSGGTYVGGEVIIVMVGTSSAVRKSGFRLNGTEILYSGSYGVVCQFVDEIRIEDANVHNVGHLGMCFLSCNHGRVSRSRVKTITPGTGGDAYGISVTHDSTDYDIDANVGTKLALNPFCWDWVIDDNDIEDSVNTGLDAHGAYETIFTGNRVYACKRAIQLAGSSGDATGYAGSNNVVIGNTCDANTAAGGLSGRENTGVGIETSGGGAGTVKHDSVIVADNIVRNHGTVSSAAGAIMARSTKNIKIISNIITKWGGVGIDADANDNTLADNHIGQLANPADSFGYAITTTSVIGNIAIISNAVRAEAGTAAVIGFRFVDLATRPRIIGNDFAAATSLPISGYADGFQKGADYPSIIFATDAATTVDISVLTRGVPGEIRFAYTAPATVTNLTNGWQGQVVTLIQTNTQNITFNRDNAVLSAGANWVGSQYDTITIKYVGALWYEICRSVNA